MSTIAFEVREVICIDIECIVTAAVRLSGMSSFKLCPIAVVVDSFAKETSDARSCISKSERQRHHTHICGMENCMNASCVRCSAQCSSWTIKFEFIDIESVSNPPSPHPSNFLRLPIVRNGRDTILVLKQNIECTTLIGHHVFRLKQVRILFYAWNLALRHKKYQITAGNKHQITWN